MDSLIRDCSISVASSVLFSPDDGDVSPLGSFKGLQAGGQEVLVPVHSISPRGSQLLKTMRNFFGQNRHWGCSEPVGFMGRSARSILWLYF